MSISQPPASGPSAPKTAPAAAQVPTARPRASPLNPAPRRARLAGISRAAPIPCAARAASSQAKPGASAQASEAALKIAMPARQHLLSAVAIAGDAAQQEQRAERQQVGVDEPADRCPRRARRRQIALDRRQADVDDRAVDERQARSEDRRRERSGRVLGLRRCLRRGRGEAAVAGPGRGERHRRAPRPSRSSRARRRTRHRGPGRRSAPSRHRCRCRRRRAPAA